MASDSSSPPFPRKPDVTVPPRPWLLITDLDGTLLDHVDYSHAPVDALLARLREQRVPVVFNSSKTKTELEAWRREMNNEDPFIAENGAAIYIPRDYFAAPPSAAVPQDDYWLIELGVHRRRLLHWLEEYKQSTGLPLVHYANTSLDKIAALTGLSHDEAAASAARDYSEPIVWEGNDAEKRAFIEAAHHRGFTVLQGGRFLHLLGHCDKGIANRHLAAEFLRQQGRAYSMIALGDSGNDAAMLEAADLAIVIRSPAHDIPTIKHHNILISDAQGPAGWREAIEQLEKQP